MQLTEHIYSTHIQEDPNTFGAMHPGGTHIYFVGDPNGQMWVPPRCRTLSYAADCVKSGTLVSELAWVRWKASWLWKRASGSMRNITG